jgi:hypothetical protein
MSEIVVETLSITGLNESMWISGLPHSAKPEESAQRASTLAKSPVGSGHDCFLKGITVLHKLRADHSFWLQWQRYHFHDIVSSTSKMHSAAEPWFLDFSDSTPSEARILAIKLQKRYREGEIKFEEYVLGLPLGLRLSAVVTTNYLQLKSIYNQRKRHKMPAWQEYCEWIRDLPFLDSTFASVL